MRNTLVVIFFFLAFTAFSQVENAQKRMEVLCSDSLFGRGYIHSGDQKAAHYLKKEFISIGLEKAPFLPDYFQPFSFDVNTFPENVSVVNGRELNLGTHYLVESVSGSYKGEIDYVFIDSTLLKNEDQLFKTLDPVLKKEKNGVVIDIRNTTPVQNAEIKGQFTRLASFTNLVYLTNEKFTWSVGRVALKHAIISIQDSVFNKNEKLTINVSHQWKENHTSQNVIGWIPGKRKTKKTIVVTAHYDHLGGIGDKVYFPGANDNASGTAMLLSLAEAFIEQPIKHNLLFIAFAGEEAGLLGSNHFVEENVFPLDNIRFLVNLDIMGSGEEGITVVNGKQLQHPFKKLQRINSRNQFVPIVKPRGETQNSDHYPFYKNGVPAFFIYTVGENKNYHDIFDTYENINFSNYSGVYGLVFQFVRKI